MDYCLQRTAQAKAAASRTQENCLQGSLDMVIVAFYRRLGKNKRKTADLIAEQSKY